MSKAPAVTKTMDIRDLKDAYLDCRDLRHAWGRPNDWEITRNSRGKIIEYTRVVVCRKCGTERHEKFLVPSMDLANRRYVYPEGFLLLGSQIGSSHSKTQQVRLETVRRAVGEEIT